MDQDGEVMLFPGLRREIFNRKKIAPTGVEPVSPP